MRIQYNIAAFRKIRYDPVVVRRINATAERGAQMAGKGYEAGRYNGRSRYRGSIMAATPRARADNAKNNTLARVLSALR